MPSSSSSSNLPLHLIGTRAFLPALLAYIRNLANPTSLPLDHVIFQSILLCLIAGDKHLILRAPEEDVGLTVKLVVWTLSCIFNLPTQKLKIRNKSSTSTSRSSSRNNNNNNNNVSLNPATDPHAFLRSLFLQSASRGRTSSNSNQTSQDEGYEGSGENVELFGHHHHQHNHNQHRRQRSGGKHHQHHNQKHGHKPHHEYLRSRSFPNNLAAAALVHGASGPPLPPPPMADTNTNIAITPESGAPPSILKPQPLYPYPNRTPHPHPHPHHACTDEPLPQAPAPSLPPIQTKSIPPSKTPLPVLQLPQALVLSGLEHASDAIHRSLARVLGERRVVLESRSESERTTSSDAEAETDGVFARDDDDDDESGVAGGGGGGGGGVWALPEGFITVYVCPWNARERPNLHKSLLDKFAMSANVFVPQSVRRDFHLLPFVAASAASPSFSFSTALPAGPGAGSGIGGGGGGGSRPFHPNFVSAHAHSNPGTPAPSFAVPLPPVPISTNNSNTPPIYTKPLPSPSPIHPRPSTHFTSSSPSNNNNNNTFNLPPPPPPILPDEIIPRSFIVALQSACKHRTSISYRMSLYLSDIFSATRHHPRLDAMLLTARAVRDAEELVRAARVVGNDLTGMEVVRREEESYSVGVGAGAGVDGEGDEGDEDETTSFDEHGDRDRISKEYVRLSGDGDQSVLLSQEIDVDVDSDTAHNHPSSSSSHRTKTKPPDLDVTEVHVARIVPRVISHRVRLRNGPEDEVLASALFGATFKPLPTMMTTMPVGVGVAGEKEEEREKERAQSSVKAVLVSILSEV